MTEVPLHEPRTLTTDECAQVETQYDNMWATAPNVSVTCYVTAADERLTECVAGLVPFDTKDLETK